MKRFLLWGMLSLTLIMNVNLFPNKQKALLQAGGITFLVVSFALLKHGVAQGKPVCDALDLIHTSSSIVGNIDDIRCILNKRYSSGILAKVGNSMFDSARVFIYSTFLYNSLNRLYNKLGSFYEHYLSK